MITRLSLVSLGLVSDLGIASVNGYLGSFPEICVGTFCECHDFLGIVALFGGFM